MGRKINFIEKMKKAIVLLALCLMMSFVGISAANSYPSAPSNITGSVSRGDTAATRQAITTTSISLSGTADANVTIKVEISIDNGVTWTEQATARTTADSSGNWTTTITIAEGVTTGIRVRAVDSDGNESSSTLFGYVMADTSSPGIMITSPVDGTSTYQASITVTGIVTKDAWESWSDLTLVIQVGTAAVTVPITNGSFTYSVALAEGINTILISVTDGVSGISSDTVTVTRVVFSVLTSNIHQRPDLEACLPEPRLAVITSESGSLGKENVALAFSEEIVGVTGMAIKGYIVSDASLGTYIIEFTDSATAYEYFNSIAGRQSLPIEMSLPGFDNAIMYGGLEGTSFAGVRGRYVISTFTSSSEPMYLQEALDMMTETKLPGETNWIPIVGATVAVIGVLGCMIYFYLRRKD